MTVTHQHEKQQRAIWSPNGLIVALFFPAGVVEKFETNTVYVHDNSPVIEFSASNGQTMVTSVPFKIMENPQT